MRIMVHAVFRGGGVLAPLHVMSKLVILTLVLLVTPQLSQATANLNLTLNMVLDPQQPQIRFGSSVAFWRRAGKMSLAVGAPLAPFKVEDTSYPLGNVFLCTLEGRLKGQCTPYNSLPDLIPNDKNALEFGKEYFEEMGIGMAETLSYSSTNESDSVLLACGPRFPRYVIPKRKGNDLSFMTRGGCFRMTGSSSKPDRIMPFSRRGEDDDFVKKSSGQLAKNNEVYTGFGLAGFSAAIAQDETIIMGSPNTYYGQGSLSSWSSKYKKEKYRYGYSKSNFSTNAHLDYNRQGWATTLGKFKGETEPEIIATSAPQEHDAYGQIKFFKFVDKKLSDKKFTKIDAQSTLLSTVDAYMHGFNSFYGYALAAGDLDKDGSQELIVGAPFAEGKNRAKEGGKVFVYYGPLNDNVIRETQVLEGPTSWLRFGSAVVSDDFNQDGYYDVAVGAPYGENGWGGAIYIYMGGRDGLCEKTGGICHKPDLLICASDFSPPGSGSSGGVGLQFTHTTTTQQCEVSSSSPLLGLGFSLATADVDDNGYPDLLIGAPKADKALLIRSAPVVVLEGNIFFEPKRVQLGNKTCVLEDRSGSEKVICFKLIISIHYDAHRLNIRNLGVVYKIKLDDKVLNKRILFKHNNEAEMEWSAFIPMSDSSNSTDLFVYVKPGDVDFTKKITASLTMKLKDNQHQSSIGQKMDPVPPVLDKPDHVFSTIGDLICEDEKTCFSTPNVKFMELGSMAITVNGDSFKVLANISIVEDYTLGIIVYVKHPEVLTPSIRARVILAKLAKIGQGYAQNKYKNIKRIDDSHHAISIDERIKIDTQVTIELEFKYESPYALMMYLNRMNASKFKLDFNVTTHGDKDPSDNAATLTVEALTDIDLTVQSFLIEDNILVNDTKLTWSKSQIEDARNNDASNITKKISGDDLGPNIDYKIVITNNGPAYMYKAEVIFELPLSIDGFPLFYVTEKPMAEGASIRCDPIDINPLKLDFKTDNIGNQRQRSLEESTENEVENDKSHERKKRMADYKSSTFKAAQGNESRSSTIDCSEMGNCESIRCSVSYLAPDKSVIITLKNSRIVIASLLEFQPDAKDYQLSGQVKVITNQPGGGQQETESTATTQITLTKETAALGIKDLPWWWLLLAILGGILLILFFSFCLYKCGFFKRNRHPIAAGKEKGSAQKIVESNTENVFVTGGIENRGSVAVNVNDDDTESTPLNKRKQLENDAGFE